MTHADHSRTHAPPTGGGDELTIRRSCDRDRDALARLAELDTARPPTGPYLLAEEGGELRAAIPLAGGPAIADPFRRTGELVALLELRSMQLAAPSPGPARVRRRRLRRPRAKSVGDAGLAFAGAPPRR